MPTAIASMARLGLAGSGRLYLLVMPVVAALLLGSRAGYLSAGVSLLIYAAFTYLAGTGQLEAMLTQTAEPDLAGRLAGGRARVRRVSWSSWRFWSSASPISSSRALASQQRTSSELASTARTLQRARGRPCAPEEHAGRATRYDSGRGGRARRPGVADRAGRALGEPGRRGVRLALPGRRGTG